MGLNDGHLQDAAGNAVTTTSSGSTVAVDTSITVAGVAIDPRVITSVPTTTDLSGSDTLSSLNDTVVMTCNGCSTISVSVTGTWSASIAIQAQSGDGNWITVPGTNAVDGTTFSLFAGNTTLIINSGGWSQMRLLMYAYTSGSASVTWNASSGVNQLADAVVVGNIASGNTDSGAPVKVGGRYNSSLPTLTTGQRGDLQLNANAQLITAPSDLQGTDTLSSLDDTVVTSVVGHNFIYYKVTGTWSASIGVEATSDGVNWDFVYGTNPADGTIFNAFAGNTPLLVPCGGYRQIRLRSYAYTSGTATVAWTLGMGPNNSANQWIVGNRGSGSSDSGFPVKVGGRFNTALPTITDGQRGDLQLDANARVIIAPLTTASNTTVTPPTLTKGTQGSTGFSVQDLKDAGRVHINLWATAAAAGTTGTQTAITLTRSSGTAANDSAVSFVVTSGKRFRITNFTVGARGHNTATAQLTTFNLRINTGGAVITTSTPIVLSGSVATPATANSWDRLSIPIPDGFEILGDGTLQFGLTAVATYTTNAPTWFATITGFEY